MSYQVLARKWRPKSFPELVGQAHVKNTLINALDMGRLHHAYLFTGTRGVGKTTIARIFAKSLNCEQGITANPCGQCDACQTIEQGHFVDLIEIDAASRTKVEDTREILDNVQYAPTRGRFKVYLIDEVHMLSRHSFNALLKTLEEPPAHVKFLLATTDPQKLPITILSRCLQFNLKALSRLEITEHLTHILGEESIAFDDESLKLLAKSADGSLRDALSLTDQAIAQSNGGLQIAEVRQMLGTIDKQWSIKLLAHIVNQNPEKALSTVVEIAQFMPDYKGLLDQLLSIFHLAAMAQLVPTVAQIDENQQAFITRLAQKLSPQDIQLYYQLLLNGKKDIDLAPDARMGFEMVLLRLMAFQPLNTVERPAVGDTVKVAAPQTAALPIPDPEPAPEVVEKKIEAKKNTEIRPEPLKQAETPVQHKPEPPTQPAPPSQPEPIEKLNEQQNTLLFAAEQQGFKPVKTVKTVEPVMQTQPAPAPAPAPPTPQSQTAPEPVLPTSQPQAVPAPVAQAPLPSVDPQSFGYDDMPPMEDISFSNDDDDEYGNMGYDQPPYLEMDMAGEPPGYEPQPQKPQLPSIQPVGKATDENFEDPVAAILANRNLPIEDMFGASAEQQNTIQSETKALPESEPEPSAKKPIAREGEPAPIPRAEPVVEQRPLEQIQAPPQAQPEPPEPFELSSIEKAPTPEPIQQPKPAEPAPVQPQQMAPVETPPPVEQIVEQAVEAPSANPSGTPRWAADVDQWASLIEQMGLGGLVRLLAVKSVWHKQDKVITLTVSQTEQHLDSKGLRDQLTKALIRVLNEVIELELVYTTEEHQTPFNIQRQIEADRLANAKQLIYQDPLIVALQQQFAAQVDDSTIAAVG